MGCWGVGLLRPCAAKASHLPTQHQCPPPHLPSLSPYPAPSTLLQFSSRPNTVRQRLARCLLTSPPAPLHAACPPPRAIKRHPWSTPATASAHCSAPLLDLPADRGVTDKIRHSTPSTAWPRPLSSWRGASRTECRPTPLTVPTGARSRSSRTSPSLRRAMCSLRNSLLSSKSMAPSKSLSDVAHLPRTESADYC
jgi:hypothetical protein